MSQLAMLLIEFGTKWNLLEEYVDHSYSCIVCGMDQFS
jgi:hypothetical protein